VQPVARGLHARQLISLASCWPTCNLGANTACFWPRTTTEGSIKVELEAGENLASFLGRLFVGGGTLGSRQDSDGENGERNRQAGSPANGVRH
jgi:hypothetical protein